MNYMVLNMLDCLDSFMGSYVIIMCYKPPKIKSNLSDLLKFFFLGFYASSLQCVSSYMYRDI